MDIVILDSDGTALMQTDDWSASIAYGDDENRFELSGLPMTLTQGMRWQVDGTPYAGVVDTVCPSMSSDGTSSVSYKGRTVQGILENKIICPPSGSAHMTATGDLNDCIADVLDACDLTDVLMASTEACGVEVSGYEYRRYVDAYSGLRMMLQSVGYRLGVTCSHDGVTLSAVEADTYGDIPSEVVPFSAERTYRPVNHMIGLGSGELTEREVVDWYADESGNLSQTQTLFGVDEVADTVNLSSSSDLSADTKSKLSDEQGEGSFTASLPDGIDIDVGDYVTASDAATGIGVLAQVTKVVVTVTNGIPTYSYSTDTPEWPEEED